MSEGREGEGGGLMRGGFERGVSGVEDGFAAERLNLGAEVAETAFAAGGDDEIRTMLGQDEGGSVADAGAGSGDEGYFVGEGDGGGWHDLRRLPEGGC